jgi:acid phosphatase
LRITVLLVLAACGDAGPITVPTASQATTPTPSGAVASPDASPDAASPSEADSDTTTPVFVIVFENTDISDLSRDDAPYLNSLAREYAQATNYYAVARPSQPNYLALFSGSTHGVADNEPHDIDAPTLADQIEEAGGSWRVAAENVPDGCFTGEVSAGGRDGEGAYTRKHNPAISTAA